MRTSKVEVVPYDASWTKNFLDIKNEISKVLDKLALSIEHVGSTAVCGLWAKPIIDINTVRLLLEYGITIIHTVSVKTPNENFLFWK